MLMLLQDHPISQIRREHLMSTSTFPSSFPSSSPTLFLDHKVKTLEDVVISYLLLIVIMSSLIILALLLWAEKKKLSATNISNEFDADDECVRVDSYSNSQPTFEYRGLHLVGRNEGWLLTDLYSTHTFNEYIHRLYGISICTNYEFQKYISHNTISKRTITTHYTVRYSTHTQCMRYITHCECCCWSWE